MLLIGEHGDYPRSALGQEMLPRRYFFEQICGVIAESDRPIPVYNDKHLSYRWDDAHWMYTTAKQLDIPLWAGSALPVGWRRPNFEHPLDAPIDEALSIGFHMIERYGFHALESLQGQVERRQGGETGVRSVQCLSGDAVWRAADEGRWSFELADHALGTIEDGPESLDPSQVEDPHVFLIEYCDGLKGAALMLGDNGYVRKFAYAAKRGNVIDAIEYHTDSGATHAVFSYMGLNIEDFFLTGIPSSPVERTYLTTGILEAVMRSHGSGGAQIETPHLAIRYTPTESQLDDLPALARLVRPSRRGKCRSRGRLPLQIRFLSGVMARFGDTGGNLSFTDPRFPRPMSQETQTPTMFCRDVNLDL